MSKPSSAPKASMAARKPAGLVVDAPTGLLAWVPDLLAIAGLVAVLAIVVAALA